MTEKTSTKCDVAIAGGGPAGCSAGVFCSRVGLDTVVVSNGRSMLQKCAFVENYLGFPAGIELQSLLDLLKRHAREAGCTMVEASVSSAALAEDDFVLTLDQGSFTTSRLLAASWSDSDYLEALCVETVPESGYGSVSVVPTDGRGQTNVDGVYAAGRITDTHHQAIVNAGDGARVVLEIVKKSIPTSTTTGPHPTATTNTTIERCRSASRRLIITNEGGVQSTRTSICVRSLNRAERHKSTSTYSLADAFCGTSWWVISYSDKQINTA